MNSADDGGPGDASIGEVPGTRRVARRLAEAPMLARVVAELKEIDRRTGIDRTLAIGDLILNQFFGGDPATWRDRRRNKNNSIRRLAERADCPFCRSALNEAVGVYVAVMELPCVRTFGHVCASHVAAVLTLPTEERQRMLEQAERERWGVRELREKVISFRRKGGERRGRPRAAIENNALSALRDGVLQIGQALGRLDDGGLLEPGLAQTLRTVATELGALHDRALALADRRIAVAPVRTERVMSIAAIVDTSRVDWLTSGERVME